MNSFEKKSTLSPGAHPGTPPDPEHIQPAPLLELPYKPYEKSALPADPYVPYPNQSGASEVPYKPYEKPAGTEPPYKPYARKAGVEEAYEPYKGK